MLNRFTLSILISFFILGYNSDSIEDLQIRSNAMEDKYFQGDMKGIDYSEKNGILTIENDDYDGTWQYGTVPYEIESDFTESDIVIIKGAMKAIEDQTRRNGLDCIRFIPRANERPYLNFVNKHGCYSYVGRQSYGIFSSSAQDISIKRGACMKRGIIMHELLHALGLHHEHTREDRDKFIKINLDNMESSNRIHFLKYSGQPGSSLPYDVRSIMHHDSVSFSKDGNLKTISSNQNIVLHPIAQKVSMTSTDVQKIRDLYKCN